MSVFFREYINMNAAGAAGLFSISSSDLKNLISNNIRNEKYDGSAIFGRIYKMYVCRNYSGFFFCLFCGRGAFPMTDSDRWLTRCCGKRALVNSIGSTE